MAASLPITSARSALQLDLVLRPDVVILDLLLPRAADGLGVLRELTGRGRPVVAISVWGSLGPRALASGAASFMEKGSPLIDQLPQAIRTAVTDTGARASTRNRRRHRPGQRAGTRGGRARTSNVVGGFGSQRR